MIFPTLVLSIAFFSFGRLAEAATAAEWASRSIYQVMTDRFATTNGSKPDCDLMKYCGGTWAGITKNLDYIQSMGFTSIQISPVVKNFEGDTSYGEAFHGYWPQDWYALNEHFGTADDLKGLAKGLHDRDMYLMVDVVINDMAIPIKEDMTNDTIVDYSKLNPFNDEKYYHPWCNLTSYFNIPVAQKCWLGSSVVALPDLDTENPVVESMVNSWIKELVANYSIDGLRIDAAKHVNDEFLHSFVEAAGVFTFGEVYNVDVKDVCRYQDFMDGVPNFPTYFPLIEAFAHGNMLGLGAMVDTVREGCKNVSYMGTFVENHDLPRFASINPDLSLALNAVAFTILADGIPTMYQNQEQHVPGNYSPFNRGPLWSVGYDTKSPIYNLTSTLNKLRNHAIATDPLYVSNTSSAVILTNDTYATRKGSEGSQVVGVFINEKGAVDELILPGGFKAGTSVVEVLSCNNLTVDAEGKLKVKMSDGRPKAFYPGEKLEGSGLCGRKLAPKVKVEEPKNKTDSGNDNEDKPSEDAAAEKKKNSGFTVQPVASLVAMTGVFVIAFVFL